MHLEPEQIQRWLHGELEGGALGAAERHVAQCPECRERLQAARLEEAEIFGLLRQLDRPAPPVRASEVAARANASADVPPTPSPAPAPLGPPAPWPRTASRQTRRPQAVRVPGRGALRARWQRRAAAVVLAIACGGVAYALPGSPLPDWFEQAAKWATGGDAPPTPEPPAADEPVSASPAPPPATAGIAVTPGEHFVIRFAEVQAAGAVVVSPTDGGDIVVRARNGSATFTTHAGGLLIDNAGSTADYQIELPRGAPWVEIQLAGHRLYLKEAARESALVPAESAGRYTLTLTPPGR